jgi:hypothetical protein
MEGLDTKWLQGEKFYVLGYNITSSNGLIFIGLQSITSQKTELFIGTAVGTSNPA